MKLTTKEMHALGRLEKVIADGRDSFVSVGKALLEIRMRKLYRETHGSFEEYCRERWGMGKWKAYRLLAKASPVEAGQKDGQETLQNATKATQSMTQVAALPAGAGDMTRLAESWRDERAAEIAAEEEVRRRRLVSEPAKPERDLREQMERLITRLEKLAQRADTAAGDYGPIAERLERLAAVLRDQ